MLESSGTNRSCDLTIIFIDHRSRSQGASIMFWRERIAIQRNTTKNFRFNVSSQLIFSGVNVEGEIPLPIPNREVKPPGADGTMWVTAWESRKTPGFF